MRYLLIILSCFLYSFIWAQESTIKGKITDSETGEPLIGATVLYEAGKGSLTDYNGEFTLSLPLGDYTLQISYTGFEPIQKAISVNKKNIFLEFKMGAKALREVTVVADVAQSRETPVAFSNISVAKLEEELASQDLPMVLNSTPGVYATQQGGGDGDARVTIRGFNQRNLAVMLDGVPVNDMENGWVYWSNWFGLDAITRNIQVQRGLGASKLAIPSVGGTMNIITKGADNKKSVSIKQEYGSNMFLRTSLGINSGKMENGWAYTLAASYKRGDGWADQTFSRGYFYYLKIQKELGKHFLSISAMGAPQSHGQRSYKQPITFFSGDYAEKYGISDSLINAGPNYGLSYNPHWGFLERYTIDDNGDTTRAPNEVVSERVNYYHKPMFQMKDFWSVSDKLYISNILYASIGKGGGTGNLGNVPMDSMGQHNYQVVYNTNAFGQFNSFNDQQFSSTILRSSINNHYWFGGLSTFNYLANDQLTYSGGLDLRHYRGEHFRSIYDLLGGDFYFDNNNMNQTSNIKYINDTIDYHNDGIVKWGGVFGQVEYKSGLISTFLNVSGAYTGYKRIDYFKKKDLVIGDTVISQAVGYGETFTHDGQEYTSDSPEARHAQTDWKYIPGFTIKGGLNYNLNEFNNIFFNTGYLSKAQRFNNIFDNNNSLFRDIENEHIFALELGYSFHSPRFSSNLNLYRTQWENKPAVRGITILIDDVPYSANVNGIDALHQGFELDFIYKISDKLSLEGIVSIGDWRWTSGDTVRFMDDQGQPVFDDNGKPMQQYFNAKDVHVGDAAQTQYSSSIKYQITKGIYFKARLTYFDRYYADFDPLSLDGSINSIDENGNPRDSWKIPAYKLMDIHFGYSTKMMDKYWLNIRCSILNALNEKYISDARNNDPFSPLGYSDFDAKSSAVFFGLGRRFNTSLRINF